MGKVVKSQEPRASIKETVVYATMQCKYMVQRHRHGSHSCRVAGWWLQLATTKTRGSSPTHVGAAMAWCPAFAWVGLHPELGAGKKRQRTCAATSYFQRAAMGGFLWQHLFTAQLVAVLV